MARRSYSVYRTASPERANVQFAVLPSQRWREMLHAVSVSTDALEQQVTERGNAGQIHSAYEVGGPHLWNPWEWTEQTPPAGVDGCPTELLIWADVWQSATANLAALGAVSVPYIDDPQALAHWESLIERNLGLLGPASNLQPEFFNITEAFPVPGWRPIAKPLHSGSGGTAPFTSSRSAGGARLATDAEMRGGGVPGPYAATEIPALIIGEAPETSAAGFVELLGPFPIGPNWLRGVIYDLRSRAGLVVDHGGGGPLAVPSSWQPRTAGPEVTPGAQFYVEGPNGQWLGKEDPRRGWDLLVAAWARSGGAVQRVTKPDGGTNTEVVVDLSARFEGRRLRAAYFSRLNLLDVTLRTAGFYVSSYAAFAVAHGYPGATDLSTQAGELWAALQRSTRETAQQIAGPTGGDAGLVISSVVGVLAVIPIAGQIIAVAYAVVVALEALLLEIGGAAVGHGVYAVQPLFVRQFIGDCSTNTLVSAAGAAVVVQDQIIASREALVESVVERHDRQEAESIPWLEIGLGVATAVGLGFGFRALFGGERT